jgi:hypothetical protein
LQKIDSLLQTLLQTDFMLIKPNGVNQVWEAHKWQIQGCQVNVLAWAIVAQVAP